MNRTVTTNDEQQVYVIPAGKDGYSCLGYDVLLKRLTALANELNIRIKPQVRGSMVAYELYQFVVGVARKKFESTGWRSQSELYAPFIGHEGRRVEVEYNNGEKERFYIGKSTGFIPCHLMIKQINSSGGGAVLNDFIKSWKFIGNKTRR